MAADREVLRGQLLTAAGRLLGLTPGDPEVRVLIRLGSDKVLVSGPVPGPWPVWDGPVTLARLPELWKSVLLILAGADTPLPAAEVERRLRPGYAGERATPEVALRLKDLEECGL